MDIKIINRNTKIRRQTKGHPVKGHPVKGHPVKGQYTYNNVKEQQIDWISLSRSHNEPFNQKQNSWTSSRTKRTLYHGQTIP